MGEAVQLAALCVVTAVLGALVRKKGPEFSLLLALACGAVCLLAVGKLLEPVVSFLEQLQALANVNAALLAPLLKTVGVGILTQIASAFCADAGEQGLAKIAELCGTFLALCAALPLAKLLLQTLNTVLGG